MKYRIKKKTSTQAERVLEEGSEVPLMSSPEIEQAAKDGTVLPSIKLADDMLSQRQAGRVLVPMVLIAGVLLGVTLFGLVSYCLEAVENRKANERKVDAIVEAHNSLLANSIIYSSDIYVLSITTDEWLQYNHPDDVTYGIISVSDMGSVSDIIEAESVIWHNIENYSATKLNITDTNSYIYQQGLPAFEIKNEVAYMAALYYYDDERGRLYNLTYSNVPEYYEDKQAKAIKDILSIKFE